MTLLIMAICAVMLEKLKIKRAQEARETQFVFQNNEILRSSKCLKTWTK